MRFDIDTYREIADSIVRNKKRSLLTGFGIFWGLFMLLFLIGGGKGLKEMLNSNFEGSATNALLIAAQNTSMPYKGLQEGRWWQLENTDVERLRMMIPEAEIVTGQVCDWGKSAVRDAHSFSCNLQGVTQDFAKIDAPRLKYGRYINEIDVLNERKVCVIGKRVYNELFPEGGDPCGQNILVGSTYFRVVGLDISPGTINVNGNTSSSVRIPMSVAQKLMRRGDNLDVVCLVARSGVSTVNLEKRVRQIVARQHRFDPADEPAMLAVNLEQIFSMVDSLFKGVDFLILLVGLGTLLAGAIGVSNIMMVTVKERTVEIGIRRAIGAMPQDILAQIIEESIALTLVAGSFGIVFSVLMLNLTEMLTGGQASFQITFLTAVMAALLLALLGAAAGLAPALRAMHIKPVDAMRDE